MPYAVLEKEIKSLPFSLQQDIESYAVSVIEKYKNDFSILNEKKSRLDALDEFAGSMKGTWKDVDALEYQKNLRAERSID